MVKDCVSHNYHVEEIGFSAAALWHRVPKPSVRYVMATAEPVEVHTRRGSTGWLYVGRDEGGRELEAIVVDVTEGGRPAWLVIHAMPTSLNKGKTGKKMRKRRGKR